MNSARSVNHISEHHWTKKSGLSGDDAAQPDPFWFPLALAALCSCLLIDSRADGCAYRLQVANSAKKKRAFAQIVSTACFPNQK
jgi:hypothetical protein